jgi:transcriptional regulator with XRE-family HTH domain
MEGKELERIIRYNGLTPAEIARQLGDSQQKLGAILKSSDVRSSYVEKIAQVLKLPVAHLYGEGLKQTINGSHNTAVAGNSNVLNAEATEILKSQLDEKDSQIRKSQEQIDRLLSIIEKKQ